MKPANEHGSLLSDASIPIDSSLEALFHRLETLAMEPGFRLQREIALGRALWSYLLTGQGFPIAPLPEEVALAKLYLYADFYPEDGQFSLVEQVRDLIEVHVPEEERAWLDPLRHSYMDLLEMVTLPEAEGEVLLRSLGDGREFRIARTAFKRPMQLGQVLLTRLIRLPDRVVLPGTAVVLSSAVGHLVFERALEQRREMEVVSGAFELGEWEEFCKRYGYGFLGNLAQARVEAVVKTEADIRYRTLTGDPVLYGLAIYAHHEFLSVREGLCRVEGLDVEGVREREASTDRHAQAVSVWVRRDGSSDAVVARVTLTPVQLIVECDSPNRLDGLKHQLASAFGYSLHFRADAIALPAHPAPEVDLGLDEWPSITVVVTPEEEQRLLGAFLESAYLEWADVPSPVLHDRTPRHAAADPGARAEVAALIDQLEQDDLCRRRTGQPGYDFDRLRAHVGL